MTLLNGTQVGGVSRRQSAEAARAAVAEAKAILLDWDGCIALGDRPTEAAVRLLAQHAGRVAVVSNNTTSLPEEFSRILARHRLEVPPELVVLAGVEALARASEDRTRRTLVLSDPRMRAVGRRMGLKLAAEGADQVVLLRDTRFSYARLGRAAAYVRDGARLIVANPDLTHPGPGGCLVPETGALLAGLMACLGEVEPDLEIIGKPQARLFETACARLGVSPAAAVMIGDNPATDLAGAAALGMGGILIGGADGLDLADLVA